MKFRKPLLAAGLACFAAPLAIAQSAPDVSVKSYVPQLADIMNAVQLRHLKLYFAARARNWELADFELRQVKTGLSEAAVLYSGLLVTNITTLAGPMQALSGALKAKDERKFGCVRAAHQRLQRLPSNDGPQIHRDCATNGTALHQ